MWVSTFRCIAATVFALALLRSEPCWAYDPDVPMPGPEGWPTFPVPVDRAAVPDACGGWWHATECAPDPSVELALEREFWTLIGNLDTPESPALAGLLDWVDRTERYLGYKGQWGRPASWNPYLGPQASIARLTMFLSASQTALFRVYRLEELVAGWSGRDLFHVMTHLGEFPGFRHVVRAVQYGDEALRLNPSNQNIQAFRHGSGAFVQWTALKEGRDLGALLPNVRGGVGLDRPLVLGWPGGREGIEALVDLAAPCADAESCTHGAGTEGLFASAAVLGLLSDTVARPDGTWPGTEDAESFADVAIRLFYDEDRGECGAYACRTTTSEAPFKKIGGLLLIAEFYAKMGELDSMRRVHRQVRALADQQQWPFTARLDDIVDRLEGQGDYVGRGLVDRWTSDPIVLGYVQFPLPPSLGVWFCSNCHFGGTVEDESVYASAFSASDTPEDRPDTAAAPGGRDVPTTSFKQATRSRSLSGLHR